MEIELEDEQIERYARHLVLPEIGEEGQLKLLQSRVLVIGAGGLGSPLLLYLAAAGVGTIGVIDDDAVDLSNLQRQIAHDTSLVSTTTRSTFPTCKGRSPTIPPWWERPRWKARGVAWRRSIPRSGWCPMTCA